MKALPEFCEKSRAVLPYSVEGSESHLNWVSRLPGQGGGGGGGKKGNPKFMHAN